MDSYYISIKIAKYFSQNITGLVGTIRKNRIHEAGPLVEPKRKGEYKFFINETQDLIFTLIKDRS